MGLVLLVLLCIIFCQFSPLIEFAVNLENKYKYSYYRKGKGIKKLRRNTSIKELIHNDSSIEEFLKLGEEYINLDKIYTDKHLDKIYSDKNYDSIKEILNNRHIQYRYMIIQEPIQYKHMVILLRSLVYYFMNIYVNLSEEEKKDFVYKYRPRIKEVIDFWKELVTETKSVTEFKKGQYVDKLVDTSQEDFRTEIKEFEKLLKEFNDELEWCNYFIKKGVKLYMIKEDKIDIDLLDKDNSYLDLVEMEVSKETEKLLEVDESHKDSISKLLKQFKTVNDNISDESEKQSFNINFIHRFKTLNKLLRVDHNEGKDSNEGISLLEKELSIYRNKQKDQEAEMYLKLLDRVNL